MLLVLGVGIYNAIRLWCFAVFLGFVKISRDNNKLISRDHTFIVGGRRNVKRRCMELIVSSEGVDTDSIVFSVYIEVISINN